MKHLAFHESAYSGSRAPALFLSIVIHSARAFAIVDVVARHLYLQKKSADNSLTQCPATIVPVRISDIRKSLS
ncbi:hypothetical protein M3I53_35940 [Paraburkholderia sp. CNPSo 3272]|uniref:hypothetical protein n=1 Tax=Paraburkholderia sp. CNPSo 3272 TaxID=2940931 RepID=UPI0020B745EF|nr:hypothetical protein [Paraburkholderia sp. CNPSo 3272]MCP3728440.1 hypothetical protein [Paraburkholderia sp. CNPSo 3272]